MDEMTAERSSLRAETSHDKLIADVLLTVVVRSIIDTLAEGTALFAEYLEKAVDFISHTVEGEYKRGRLLLL